MPFVNTPRKERQGLIKQLEETWRELQSLKEKQLEIEAKVLKDKENTPVLPIPSKSARPPKKAVVLPFQKVLTPEKEEDGIIVIRRKKGGQTRKVCKEKAASPNAENEAPLEWEVAVRPDLLVRSKENILALLNTGSVKALMGLHQIGKKKAQLIVDWRNQYGTFKKVEDLGKVDGISAKQAASFLKVNILSSIGNIQ